MTLCGFLNPLHGCPGAQHAANLNALHPPPPAPKQETPRSHTSLSTAMGLQLCVCVRARDGHNLLLNSYSSVTHITLYNYRSTALCVCGRTNTRVRLP